MSEYFSSLINAIPLDVYLLLLAVFCIFAVLLVSFRGVRKGGRLVFAFLLVEYVFLLYCSTVFFREGVERGYNIVPFWSYVEIYHGDELLLPQNIMNVVVFVPVGFLLGCAVKSIRWWKVLVIGCFISVSIEVLQFFFKRGFSEFDDVFHNVIGCMIGYGIYIIVYRINRYGKNLSLSGSHE